jgi:5-methylcytosine-specific restriction endonuclease McrA
MGLRVVVVIAWQRHGHARYTCSQVHRARRKLAPHEGNIDHVVPRSRGGQTTWENCVLADRRVNGLKSSRLPEEVGLQLRRRPEAPRELPCTCFIRNAHNVSDWKHFLVPLD